jgi:hypothetical protein
MHTLYTLTQTLSHILTRSSTYVYTTSHKNTFPFFLCFFHTHIVEEIRVKAPTPCAVDFWRGGSGNLSMERMWHLCQKKRKKQLYIASTYFKY